MFWMRDALPDNAASDPQAPFRATVQAATEAARGRRRLGRWLGKLAGFGQAIMRRMGDIVADRRAQGSAPGTAMAPREGGLDLNLVWDLVARAMRWTCALRARLKAEAKTANVWMERRESDFDAPDWHENLLNLRRAAPVRATAPDDCIDGKPDAEVLTQICGDLAIAAALLDCPAMVQQITATLAAARALLGGVAQEWTPLPALRHLACVVGEAVAVVQDAAMAVPAADTG